MAAESKRLLIMAGGTGGHVFPALATAELLRAQGVEVEWLGTATGIEARVVPAAGLVLNTMSVTGLRGKSLINLLRAPFRITRALWQAYRIVRRFRPHAVLGMGGFASGPGGLAARMAGVPLLVHEQNAIAGMTNRTLASFATRVLQAFPGALSEREQDTIGNPVRGPILDLPEPQQRFHDRQGPIRLLVVGGSLGAQAINELLPQALAGLALEQRPQVRHQTGERHYQATQALYTRQGVDAEVVPFIERMDEALGWADLVLCRAGALTVSELAIAGVAAILVPFPHAVDDHQTANGRYLAEAGAAELVQQRDLTVARLHALLEHYSQRPQLLQMAQKARALGRPQAGEALAQACLEVMK